VFWLWLALGAWAGLGGGSGCTSTPPPPHELLGRANFTSPQVNPVVVSADGQRVYVANTTSGTVSLLSTSPFQVTREVRVGMEPVSLALHPSGLELWVSNHVSDSVSVVDVDPSSASYGHVIETVQALDANGVTRFDEPVGIAFANAAKAYVALSSRNQIAIVDATSYQVTGFLEVRAQEPRAIAVHAGKLYVAAFESGNRTQLSACPFLSPPECTLNLQDLATFAVNPNLPDETKNIVKAPGVPDRDVFVYDTSTDTEDGAISGVSTLLYGLAVSGNGTLYVTATSARNEENGDHGSTLAALDGRMFDNQLVILSGCTCTPATQVCTCTKTPKNLEPGTPTTVTTHENSRATPYGVALSADGSTVLITAAGVNRLASLDVDGDELGVLGVGAIPKGVAFFAPAGPGGTAYVLNTLGNSVTKVTVAANGQLAADGTVTVGKDPTQVAVRRGNIAFNNAFASTTGSHSCGSCHPDGNTDQLLWRIGGSCEAIGCDPGDEPRSTMPVRGLKNTLPLHWDGTLGDPFGGGNGSVGLLGTPEPGHACDPSDADGDHDCFLDLVEASLTGVMCLQGSSCATVLTPQDQGDMATFLARVSYPPARSRRIDDTLSDDSDPADLFGLATSARQGFADFFTDQGGNGGIDGNTRTCADANGGCHPPALGVVTNSTTLAGFDAPTMRGLTDRFLQFSMGPTNAVPILQAANFGGQGASALEPEIAWNPTIGFREVTTFGAAFGIFQPVYGVRPPNLWQMFEEASTGFSGALGRQLTLNTTSAPQPGTNALLAELEAADARGVVNLQGTILRGGVSTTISFAGGAYVITNAPSQSRAQLLADAQAGTSLVTLTAQLRPNVASSPQPLLGTAGSVVSGVIGDPPLPRLASGHPAFDVTGTSVSSMAPVFVDGQPVAAVLACTVGADGFCNDGVMSIDLAARPSPDGLHLLQVQNPSGLLSNELPICVAPNGSLSLCVSD
jgi:YVTN family beta-propeller protein